MKEIKVNVPSAEREDGTNVIYARSVVEAIKKELGMSENKYFGPKVVDFPDFYIDEEEFDDDLEGFLSRLSKIIKDGISIVSVRKNGRSRKWVILKMK